MTVPFSTKYIKAVLQHRFGILFTNPKHNFHNIRNLVLKSYHFDLIIDVGANQGQWLSEVMPSIEEACVFAFEPLSPPFAILEQNFRSEKVHPVQIALGSKEETLEMFVASNNGQSSSFMRPTAHLSIHPDVKFSTREEVEVITLDNFLAQESLESQSIYLKIDAQGTEWNVLNGAKATLERVNAIEIESCMSPEYEGEVTHHKLISSLLDIGFIYFTGQPPRVDRLGRQWDLNSILVRREVLERIQNN